MTKKEVAEWLKKRVLVQPTIAIDDKGLLRGRYNMTAYDLTYEEANLLLVTLQLAKEAQSVTGKRKQRKTARNITSSERARDAGNQT